MYEKLERSKVFRDPLYGYIRVEYCLIATLIDTIEFQRLRRIRQLAGVSQVFQTAEHSRFTHSLGAYEMARRVLLYVEGAKEHMNQYEQLVFLCAALLHDLGHGPYSHAFENVLSISHEQMTSKLILGKTEVHEVLKNEVNTLPLDIASVINHEGKYPLIESLISSQIDVDRMDYLSRDAYFTGANYGVIDYERILRSMKIMDGKVLFRASGVNSLESYLMSRYHMYWQVYYHPIARAYELLLNNIYKRIYDLTKENKMIDANVKELVCVMNDSNDLQSYISLDDSYVNGMVKQLRNSKDFILRDLAISLEKRYLYSYLEVTEDNQNECKQIELKYDNPLWSKIKKYYFAKTSVSQIAYLHSDQTQIIDINDIKILKPNGTVVSLEEYSPITRGLIFTGKKETVRIFYKEPKYE